MIVTIQPSSIKGPCTAPPSKSVAQRALAVAWLRQGKTTLRNVGQSADEETVLQILEATGCLLAWDGSKLVIDSSTRHRVASADFGESGLAARMFTPLFALEGGEITLNGKGSLMARPMDALLAALTALNVKAYASNGHLPISVSGTLEPKNLTVDGSISSQTITGLIMAFAAANADDVTISVVNPVSKPYLALTLKVMEDMHINVPRRDVDFTRFTFSHQQSFNGPLEYSIEGDWSAAAFLAIAGAIAGDISIKGLAAFTEQGDKAILQPLMDAGASLSITMDEIIVRKSALKAFHFDATDHPDLFPPLAVLAAYCEGTSVIEGVHRLTHKESNRAVTLQDELGKMGIAISFQDNMMLIDGGRAVTGASVDARGDHRIAMACAIAALGADGSTTIHDAETVQKSWPSFFTDLEQLGVNMEKS